MKYSIGLAVTVVTVAWYHYECAGVTFDAIPNVYVFEVRCIKVKLIILCVYFSLMLFIVQILIDKYFFFTTSYNNNSIIIL